ncbi:MAG: hypothetical protein ACI4UK_00965 [Floccifex sp.]
MTSYSSLSSETGLSKHQVERALKNLCKTGEISKVSSSVNTLIIVTNYNIFQGFENEEKTDEGETNGKQTGNQGETKGKRRGTTKNDKNNKNERNIKEIYKEKISSFTSNDELSKLLESFVDFRLPKFTLNAFDISLNKLKKISNSEDEMIEIVKNSLEHCWMTFYPLKNKQENNPEWYVKTESTIPDQEAIDEALALQKKLKGDKNEV